MPPATSSTGPADIGWIEVTDLKKTPTGMPLRRTEKPVVERRVLGGRVVRKGQGGSERFVAELPEDRKQENHGSDASHHDCFDEFVR